MKKTMLGLALIFGLSNMANAESRWAIIPDSFVINMPVKHAGLPHSDHIEMSGTKMAVVLYWNLDSSSVFGVDRALVFPTLRTIPNDTHASFMLNNSVDFVGMLRINGKKPSQSTRNIEINGMMKVSGDLRLPDGSVIELERSIFPSMEHRAMFELYKAVNKSERTLDLYVPSFTLEYVSNPTKCLDGEYVVRSTTDRSGTFTLEPGQSIDFALIIQAYKTNGEHAEKLFPEEELDKRRAFIDNLDSNLILNTPDKTIDTEFRYAKIRGAESIYKTKGGYMHGPGGESYYAALWCNDQAEYINPFFPFLGYNIGNESALNCFRHYARFINDEYKPIPSSIIAEGDSIWNGAGDRGDAAMLAYGASRYALARGDKSEANELWPLIEWCLEYCRRQLNEHGVVRSDHDELEGRFPAGDANLCTSSLYYDALLSASYLGKELGKPSGQISTYIRQAKDIRIAIEKYFGREVQGYATYRYYAGNDVLRSWICIPLVMGIDERADQTVKALFSPEMYTADGVLTCQGFPIFWDRATLYTLRGALQAGYPEEVIPKLSDYSKRRLLGNHVPYPVEAWPEGSQRHLSAESGLYCRIITEGLFGIRPTGLKSFDFKPELPKDWDFAELKHVKAFGEDFDIIITRLSPDRLKVIIRNHNGRTRNYNLLSGQSANVRL